MIKNTDLTLNTLSRSPVWVVLGGGWGSEGKGSFIAWLVNPENPNSVMHVTGRQNLSVVRTGGPQAGHTILHNGKRFAMRQVPVGWVNPNAKLYMGPGALIDLEVLEHEIHMVNEVMGDDYLSTRFVVDRHATVVEQKHRDAETDLVKKIGSTGEGVGAAQADKVLRRARVAKEVPELARYIGDVGEILREQIRGGETAVVIESTQGWGLSLNGPFYPTCTSRDITPAQVLNDSGIPSNVPHAIVLVMRTYPIRVAGPSGEMGEEITWDELSKQTGGYVKPETTTVTKRIRRVAKWNPEYARMAVEATNADAIALSFFDYVRPDLASQTTIQDAAALVEIGKMEHEAGAPVMWVCTGFQVVAPMYKS